MNYKIKLYNKIIKDCENICELPIGDLCEKGLTDIDTIRKWLVKNLYYQMKKDETRTFADIKYELSINYEISVSSIEKLIYGRKY